jgi:hypothetical protein
VVLPVQFLHIIKLEKIEQLKESVKLEWIKRERMISIPVGVKIPQSSAIFLAVSISIKETLSNK